MISKLCALAVAIAGCCGCGGGGPCNGNLVVNGKPTAGHSTESYSGPVYRLCRGECVESGLYDAQHCGRGDACVVCTNVPPANAVTACLPDAGFTCGFSCKPLYAHCTGNAADGCETSLNTVQNCGACGRPCHGTCLAGVCHSSFEGEKGVSGLSDSDGDLAAPGVGLVWIASDGGTLDLRHGPADGGPAVTLASVPGRDGGVPPATFQAGRTLWFTTGSPRETDGGGGAVYRLEVDAPGAGPSLVADGQDGPGAVLVTGGAVFWSNTLGGQVLRARLDGGDAQVVAADQKRPRAMTFANGKLYWVDEGTGGEDGAVMSVGLDGGTPQLVSVDSTLASGAPSRTARAPVAIAKILEPTAGAATTRLPEFAVWADNATGVVWAAGGGLPIAVNKTIPGETLRQLLPAVENFTLFGGVHLYSLGQPYVPGGAAIYEAPLPLVVVATLPASTAAISEPRGAAFLDGEQVRTR